MKPMHMKILEAFEALKAQEMYCWKYKAIKGKLKLSRVAKGSSYEKNKGTEN